MRSPLSPLATARLVGAKTCRRTIIQIAVGGMREMIADTVYALADDGSVWWRYTNQEDDWHRLPELPDINLEQNND